MTTTAEFVYEEGALRLLTPVSYPEGTHLSALLTPKPIPDKGDAAYLLTLSRAERNRLLAEAAEAAAPAYEADLALPVSERELTAFTALGGEPFLEDITEE
jgi:hypothetical protein